MEDPLNRFEGDPTTTWTAYNTNLLHEKKLKNAILEVKQPNITRAHKYG